MDTVRIICCEPPLEWVTWWPGLDDAGLAGFVSASSDPRRAETEIRSLDAVAQADETAVLCGLWFPEHTGGGSAATMIVHSYRRDQALDLAYQEAVRSCRITPPLPGCLISSYEFFENQVDIGKLVGQEILFSDDDDQMIYQMRYTVFSTVKDEVVVFDFSTTDLGWANVMAEDSVDIISGAFYLEESA